MTFPSFMTFSIFKPPVMPSPGTEIRPEFKILKADFGDGYTQPTPDGLNHIRRVLSLKWDLLEADDKEAIEDFLLAHEGTKPFLYTLPGELKPVAYSCEEWSVTALAANLFNITATFRQSFA